MLEALRRILCALGARKGPCSRPSAARPTADSAYAVLDSLEQVPPEFVVQAIIEPVLQLLRALSDGLHNNEQKRLCPESAGSRFALVELGVARLLFPLAPDSKCFVLVRSGVLDARFVQALNARLHPDIQGFALNEFVLGGLTSSHVAQCMQSWPGQPRIVVHGVDLVLSCG